MKKQKKRKLRVGRLLIVLLVLSLVSFACFKFIDIPIMNIYIEGNNILTDQEIIELASLEDYPSYFSTIIFNVKKDIEKSPYVKNAKVTKGILNIKIKVKEKKVLYIDKLRGEVVTEDSSFKDERIIAVPYLINEIPVKKQASFIKGMKKIDKNILNLMSEIKYDPNDIDEDRYYVYMNDGNNVYLTVNKFEKINKYNNILENIGKQNGTIYLDYGDYFEAK